MSGRLARLAAALLLGASSAAAWAADYSVLIRHGTVIDGSGSPRRQADVAIKDDRIVLVGDVPASATADKVIDAAGRMVVPGFIDPHSHSWPGLGDPKLAGRSLEDEIGERATDVEAHAIGVRFLQLHDGDAIAFMRERVTSARASGASVRRASGERRHERPPIREGGRLIRGSERPPAAGPTRASMRGRSDRRSRPAR